MRITLIKYISREIWSVFLTCMIVFVFIMLSATALNRDELIVDFGAGFTELFSLIINLMPQMILVVMPVACLMAVLLSFIRMSSDNEIIALHSSGVSLYQLMPSVIIFAVICFFIAGFLSVYSVPYGKRTYKTSLHEVLRSKTDFAIKERIFFKGFENIVFYVNSYSQKDKTMTDIFLVNKEHNTPVTIIAKKGRFIKSRNSNIVTVQLIDVVSISDRGQSRTPELEQEFHLDSMLGSSNADELEPDEMFLGELLDFINNPEQSNGKKLASLTLYEMFSLPLSVFLFCIAGALLGSSIRAQGRTKGIIISFLLSLGYYVIFFISEYLSETGAVIPFISAFIPVVFMLLICTFLLARSADDLSYGIFDRLAGRA